MRAAYLVVYYNGRVHKIQSAYAIITGHAGTGESKWQSGTVAVVINGIGLLNVDCKYGILLANECE